MNKVTRSRRIISRHFRYLDLCSVITKLNHSTPFLCNSILEQHRTTARRISPAKTSINSANSRFHVSRVLNTTMSSLSDQHSASPLVAFYSPTIAAPIHTLTLTKILDYTDPELEYHHDYIQILFPLPERSEFNPSAPIIDEATFHAFRNSKELQGQLRKAFERILSFYGFEIIDSTIVHGITIIPAANFASASKGWVRKFNHNHLRITRILRSLRVLGLEEEAKVFLQALTDVYESTEGIGGHSLMFWQRAVRRPLWMKPEDEDGKGKKKGWLWEWEMKMGEGMNEST